MTVFDNAIIFAVHAHSGATRKNGRTPYILHPIEVASIAGTMTDDAEILAAAVLHDTVEDTLVTFDDIRTAFGERVCALVGSETEDKRPDLPPGESWEIRKKESLEKLEKATDIGVKIIWLSDKLANLRSFKTALDEKGGDFLLAFNQKDPSRQRWYYRSVLERIPELASFPAYKEFSSLIDEVFPE